jgi:hypothetical protein
VFHINTKWLYGSNLEDSTAADGLVTSFTFDGKPNLWALFYIGCKMLQNATYFPFFDAAG